MVELFPLIFYFQVDEVAESFIGLEQLDSTGLLGDFFAMQHVGCFLDSQEGHGDWNAH